MRYGNCFLGLLILIVLHKFKGKVVLLKQKNSIFPHLSWLTNDGFLHDYHRVNNLLPGCFSWMIFEGKFRSRKFRHINFFSLGC